ncbi:MAG: S8 family serine peptidase, partial [Saprospiraceae bacterium]|nr:S8 family serine peptidase [Saprospiraceae bacterium]
MRHLPLTACALFFHALAFGQNWQSKIDPAVFQVAHAGQSVDCIVVMAEQADLSEAAFIPRRKDKAPFVCQQLKATAERTQTQVLKLAQQSGSTHRPFFVVNMVQFEQADLALLEALARLPEVGRIDPNPKINNKLPRAESFDAGSDRAVEWGVAQIGADDVWALGYDGTGIVVGGQDTGYKWDHDALKSKYRGWNGSTADHNFNWPDAIHAASGGNPCGSDSPFPCDDHNHGTHTMGTMIGDDGGSNEIGVAPGAKWIGCRNMDVGNGTPTTYIECFEWFLEPTDLNDNNPTPALAPDVINNSWSCPNSEGCNSGNYATMETAVNNLVAAGVMVVVSAGNSGSSCNTINDPPAFYAGSFSVGATDNLDSIAGFSSRGPASYSSLIKPDISAPGVSVRSSIKDGTYANFSGTSMAGPHIVGTVALMLDANPNLTVNMLRTKIQSSAVPRTSSQSCGGTSGANVPNNTYGYGRADALAAVNAVLALLPVELIDFQGHLQGKSVQLQWEVAPNGSLNHFELERSGSGSVWASIHRQLFDPEQGQYGVLDPNPATGINYYRLKMVDIDGSIEYSKLVSVRWDGLEVLRLSPNPANNEMSLLANWQPGTIQIAIFDAKGQLLQQQNRQVSAALEPLHMDVSALLPGVYFVKIKDE